jgi:hypothetical protein
MSNAPRIPKITVEVEISHVDGSKARGTVFISANERVLDMLNGPGAFFPFRDGPSRRVKLYSKASIITIEPLDQKG